MMMGDIKSRKILGDVTNGHLEEMNMDLNMDGIQSHSETDSDTSTNHKTQHYLRQLVLTLNNGQLDYLSNSKTKDAVDQVYSYMAELGLQYGVLSTYDNHWFLYRPKDNPTEL
ncbi:kinase-like protein [Gigaspora margarita]|uniref:Kinase-like protein n=1 Tax=Gigaspora margarita TaxID=4874 RepID=A0A8H4EP53_GIGMA|nr:kinase-like protein [Gigaspora margarita]